jgi:hypothetical protein
MPIILADFSSSTFCHKKIAQDKAWAAFGMSSQKSPPTARF